MIKSRQIFTAKKHPKKDSLLLFIDFFGRLSIWRKDTRDKKKRQMKENNVTPDSGKIVESDNESTE